MRWFWGAAILLGACATDPLALKVTFEPDNLRDQALLITLTLRHGNCRDDGEVITTSVLDDDSDEMGMPRELGKGSFALSGLAVDNDCGVVAEGCVDFKLPTKRGSRDLVLLASDDRAVCPPTRCFEGVCSPEDAPAGDADAPEAVDAPDADAPETIDAPDAPDAPDADAPETTDAPDAPDAPDADAPWRVPCDPDSDWTLELVTSGSEPFYDTDLGIDPNDSTHYVAVRRSDGAGGTVVSLARRTSAEVWEAAQVATTSGVGESASLSFDNGPLVAWDASAYSVQAASLISWTPSSATFDEETVLASSSTGGVDLSGPYAVSGRFLPNGFAIHVFDGSNWTLAAMVASTDMSPGIPPSVVSTAEVTRVVYVDSPPSPPYRLLQVSSAASWASEVVDPNSTSYPSLALAGAERDSRIAYYRVDLGELWYATCDTCEGASTSFATERVDGMDDDVGRFASLSLDSVGNPHISYYDATNQDLKYAYNPGTGWVIESVDCPLSSTGDDVGQATSITIGSDDSVHITYAATVAGDDLVIYAHRPPPDP